MLAPESDLPRRAAIPAPFTVENGGKYRYFTGPGNVSLLGWGLGEGPAHSIQPWYFCGLGPSSKDPILNSWERACWENLSGKVKDLKIESCETLKDLKKFRLEKTWRSR